MASRIQIRRDTAVNWTEANPVLAQGEFGVETDTLKLKIGDGVTFWNDLRYYHSGSPYDAGEGISIDDMVISNTGIITLGTGTQNGTVKANGTDVFVKGLGSAAYTSSSNYATAAQGAKADTAVQPGDLATVATTGDYSDLLNKPTIPTVNNATLTIQKNGTTVKTFTANASSNVTANIIVPTKISDLTNDSNFADTDLSNLTGTGQNIGNWSTNITNCITNVPQDIKLELSNGTLTLKSGSVLYKGDGSFTKVTLANDISISPTPTDGKRIVFTNASAYLDSIAVNAWISGSTEPTSGLLWFNTTDNKIYNGGPGNWAASSVCLPLGIVTVSGNQIVSIDQVFSGFGFMGSTAFALPGVKGLIPNGRNADGTLNNISFTVNNVLTTTDTSGVTGGLEYYLSSDRIYHANFGTYSYDAESNNIVNNSGVHQNVILLDPSAYRDSGKVSSFNPKKAFRAVDYNDSDYIVNCAMPSDKYIALSTGISSGYSYIAPADGYLTMVKSGVASDWAYMRNTANGLNIGVQWSGSYNSRLYIPVAKGQSITISWNGTGTVSELRFIYANGAK